uniref:Uncharacterized protein n=1 Tax=Brassica oleracea var. oleracea TaxID=109376 RepID=A0A0D3BKU7_BRAOL
MCRKITTDRRREVQTAAPPETIVTPSDTSNLECHIFMMVSGRYGKKIKEKILEKIDIKERAEDKLPHVKGIGVSANHADERVKKLEENVSMMANNFNKLVQRFDKVEKERRMDVPQAQMQYDDKSRVDKAKRRPVVEQTESKNKVGLQHLAGDIAGDNARCIAMLHAFQEAINDYTTPPMKDLTMDLTEKFNAKKFKF